MDEGRRTELQAIKQWASTRQIEVIDAVLEHGTYAAAAEVLGISKTRVRGCLSEAKTRAARSGYAPEHSMTKTVPEGFFVKAVSTLYGEDGEIRSQWVKSQKDREVHMADMIEAMEEIAKPFARLSEPVPEPAFVSEDTMSCYIMGDPHFGMFSWHEETGNDFDLDIAEKDFLDAVDQLVEVGPPSDTAVIVNLGDMFHTDDSSNRTKRSGNALDVDTRYSKVFRVGVRAHKLAIERALAKHKNVEVKIVPGNHDDHSALLLAICLREYYDNNDRVHVDTSPGKFQWVRFGETLIGVTHGDGVKANDLPALMACDRKKDWGETEYHYWYTGHVHHLTTKEFPGCTVETFRTLAPGDAWHVGAGYRAGREMVCDVIDRKYGRICRHTVGIRQIRKA